MMKKLFFLFFFLTTPSLFAAPTDQIKQTLQVNTHFHSIAGKPSWVLILREVESGRTLPYLFEIKDNDNFWVPFSRERSYQITASKLKFGPYAVINNFCHLENGIIEGQSMIIRLRGDLTPNPNTSKCTVLKYKDVPFTIVK